ncbi:hypothetical protein BCR39DRAFT_586902 [Naematelia encephala]|uniref:GST N-terminal domain-containing protein n=1 Tax=Naematelia encephala TaxID=71784 RepID=A0A1Y2BDJ8_9TREE|nr:hypothetical protein BCR39DRAFT_586902 [Naematelia encephala]
MTDSKPKFYEFEGSCWANVPKLAISEAGFKDGDIEWININLGEGANFNPDYLKVTPAGTIPALVSDGKTFTDSTTVTKELLRLAPHPPRVSAHTSTSLVEEVHGAAHDPNATLLFARDDADYEAKKNGLAKAFLAGRQKALDKYAPDAPEEFKTFLTKKQQGNKQLLEFFTGNPDEAAKKEHFATAASLWNSVGITIRGVLTQALQKTEGPFVAGKTPGEADFHVITWLSRIITCAGVEPGSPASVAIPKLQEYTGGHAIDPVVSKYWDAWIARDSFKNNKIH